MFTFCPVVANPVTFPVKLPENAPENVVADNTPVDGTYDNAALDEIPVPVTVVAAPLNTGYTVDAVFVVAIFTIAAVVAVPVNEPLNVVADNVPVDGLTVTVDTVDVAAPDNEPDTGVNIIG
jgi:hypothetical protein